MSRVTEAGTEGAPKDDQRAEQRVVREPAALGAATAIEHLRDDRESERLGEGAYRLWQERYSPERGLEGLEAAYKAALQ